MDRPNILLIMADQLLATALPGYGHAMVQSAASDQLASDGIGFEHAYCAPEKP